MVEVQIRTREMHRTAETGDRRALRLQAGRRAWTRSWTPSSAASWRRPPTGSATASDDEYMDFLRTALYQEEVFVYTPRRELKRLPKGATPLDFAFLIHTEVGPAHGRRARQRRAGAAAPRAAERRHGRDHHLARRRSRTRTGSRSCAPPARAQQDPALAAAARATTTASTLGREMLERELKRAARRALDEQALDGGGAGARAAPTSRALYARLGEGQLSLTQVVRKLVPEKEGLAERLARARSRRSGSDAARPAASASRASTTSCCSFARCCQPVPGDRVIGIVTHGARRLGAPPGLPEHVRRPGSARAPRRGRVGRAPRRDVPGAAGGLRPRPPRRCSPTSRRRSPRSRSTSARPAWRA